MKATSFNEPRALRSRGGGYLTGSLEGALVQPIRCISSRLHQKKMGEICSSCAGELWPTLEVIPRTYECSTLCIVFTVPKKKRMQS